MARQTHTMISVFTRQYSFSSRSIYAPLFCFFVSLTQINCKKFVETAPPKTDLITITVFTDNNTALAAISNIYATMSSFNYSSGSNNSFTYLGGLSSDEMDVYAANLLRKQFADNAILPENTDLNSSLWTVPYQNIYRANAILEGLDQSIGVSVELQKQLQGEAKFIRAFAHFYLINLFGDIPLVLTTDYRINAVIPRSPKNQVYQQIITDLKDAQILLSFDYSFSNDERVRPNKSAATALLARVYLYNKDWLNAEQQATLVINNTSLYSLVDLDDVFLKNSSEAIWQLMRDNNNTNDAVTFLIASTALQPSNAALKSSLVSAFSEHDQRKLIWVDSVVTSTNKFFYPKKYIATGITSITEYSMVLRLAEQYLIRAEARARQNKLFGDNSAESDLNMIRNRAGLENIIATTLTDMQGAIEQERQLELFTEWGHRWLDLKRWPSILSPGDNTMSRADDVLSSIKPAWRKEAKLYPIPQAQILNDPAMTNAQNPGY